MSGKLIGIGVGPGDPELMTLKAVRVIKENQVIAVPGKVVEETTAYQIAVQAVPELADKTFLPLYFPMTMNRKEQEAHHRQGADQIEAILDQGKNVVFLTLGDVTIFSTFSYVQHMVENDGYEIELINGIPSFCAAAATMNQSLTEWTQPLHIIPAIHKTQDQLTLPGNYVLMKSGKKMPQIKALLKESGKEITMVENCGMPAEKRYYSLEEIPDDSGYFSLIIAKEKTPGYDL